MTDKNICRISESASKGFFIIEWRTKDDATPMPFNGGSKFFPDVLTAEWVRFNVEVKQLVALAHENGRQGVILPCIAESDVEPGLKAGLMRRDVAEAIVACLKTRFRESIHGMLDAIEWRLVECSWKQIFEAERLEESPPT